MDDLRYQITTRRTSGPITAREPVRGREQVARNAVRIKPLKVHGIIGSDAFRNCADCQTACFRFKGSDRFLLCSCCDVHVVAAHLVAEVPDEGTFARLTAT
jgi:hypothetical protein